MRTLNLVKSDESEIQYKKINFPDGQQNIVIDELKTTFSLKGEEIRIKSRLNNWRDLELILCTVSSIREIDPDIKIHLYTPYIVGARSDRKFEEGGNNYLKDVICPIINSLNFKSVTCIDPHSDVLEACIKGFRKESNNKLFAYFFQDYDSNDEKDYIFISPDAGASKKIYKLAEQIRYTGDIITCSKGRDVEGKLTRTVVPRITNLNSDYIVIDDIADGGRTSVEIAKVIKSYFDFKGKIYLIVTHGIFSKGFSELNKYFEGIYCTNSYSNIGDYVGNEKEKTNVKQLNIF